MSRVWKPGRVSAPGIAGYGYGYQSLYPWQTRTLEPGQGVNSKLIFLGVLCQFLVDLAFFKNIKAKNPANRKLLIGGILYIFDYLVSQSVFLRLIWSLACWKAKIPANHKLSIGGILFTLHIYLYFSFIKYFHIILICQPHTLMLPVVPVDTLTRTRKNPYPVVRVRVLTGRGTGQKKIP